MKEHIMHQSTTRQTSSVIPLPHRWFHLTERQRTWACAIAAVLCFISEAIHLWQLPAQYETFSVYGIVFLLIAMGQGVVGVNLLFTPRRRPLTLLTFGLWVNGLTALLYIFTHTIGVLVGLAFLPLPVEPLGVVATIVEFLTFALLLILHIDTPRAARIKQRKTRNHVKGVKK